MDGEVQVVINANIDEKAPKNPAKKGEKAWIVMLVLGIVCLLGGVGCLVFGFLWQEEERAAIVFPKIPSAIETEVTYSPLTGEVLSDPGLANAPTYCVQVPNGLDGARPQVGLTQAGVIFEAIAERGITRFAAIFQNPKTAIIGPLRSLRIYYLEWDTPFNCTIVHAGGADDALRALAQGGYRDLTENYTYMYRGNAGNRLWNNLFVTSAALGRFGADRGFNTSDVRGFSHSTPEENEKKRVDGLVGEKLNILEATEADTSVLTPQVAEINLNFGYVGSFNVHYSYDTATNSYLRSFRSGEAHMVYDCGDADLGEVNPESACQLVQLAPKAVVAMIVNEKLAWDGYHEDITAIGTGKAYVFQNGTATVGTWLKSSRDEQIRFYDEAGVEIYLAPGQTIVSAVPSYGGVEF